MSQFGPKVSNSMRLRGGGLPSSWVIQIDPRARIVAAFLFACSVVAMDGFVALGCALLTSVVLLVSAGLSGKKTLKKVMAMDGFIIFMLLMLPFTTPGEAWFNVGPFTATKEGVYKAIEITLKANAVVMTLLALVATIDAITLAHALNRLRVPENLVHLMLFSVRYIDVLKQEYFRLRTAMKARCFQMGNNLHTYRNVGYLLGMLLVRSIERSERILEAMKCRGFQGKFYLLDDFHFQRRDRLFSLLSFFFLLFLFTLDSYYG